MRLLRALVARLAVVHVLYSDNHLLAVAKPAGVPIVPDASGDESLLDQAKAWVKEEFHKPGDVFLGVVHRLDRPVSGIVLFARTSKAASRMSDQWREHRVRKIYYGVSHGPPPARGDGKLEQWLRKNPDKNIVTVCEDPVPEARGAKLARTLYKVVDRRGDRTFLELEPLTGRSHQLRVACRTLGCPLLGDLKYGADEPLPDRSIGLHALRLSFVHPTRREGIELEAPFPEKAWWRSG